MSSIIEVRTYRAKPGMRAELLQLLRTRAFPIQRELGMKILGPFPSHQDDVGFVWLRGFPNEASRDPLRNAFYEGDEWLGKLEAQVMPMLEDYRAVVVQDTEDLWSNWPAAAETRSPGPEAAMPHFAVTLVRGPNWDASVGIREQRSWPAHARFMDSLVEDGFILVGGPVGDHRQTLHLVEAPDESHIRQRFAQDPWAHDGLLEVGSVQPWALWLDFRTATVANPERSM